MAMAAKAKPANQLGNSAWNSAGTTSLLLVTVQMRRRGHVAEQGDQAEQQRVGRQQHRVLADGVGALGRGEDAGQRVRVHEGGQGRAERQRGIGQHLARLQQ